MKTLLSILFLFSVIFMSCNSDDEMIENTEVILVTPNLEINMELETIMVSVEVNQGNPDVIFVDLEGVSSQTIQLSPVGDSWTRSIFIDQGNFENGTIRAKFYPMTGTGTNAYRAGPDVFSEFETINWDASVTMETVHIGGLTSNIVTNEMMLNVSFANSSTNGEELKFSLYYGGQLIGNDTGTLIGSNGSIVIGPFTGSEIAADRSYQLLVENVDSDNPTFAFLNSTGEIIIDNNNDPVESVSLTFTSIEITANMEIHVPNIGTSSILINAEISTNSNNVQNITVKLFPQGSTTEVFEQTFTTPGSSENLNINDLLIDGLNPGTNYDLKYYLNDNSNPFQAYAIGTLSSGSFAIQFGTIVPDVNSGNVQIIWGNTSGDDVNAVWKFSGIDVNGNSLIQTDPIAFSSGMTNQVSYKEFNGYKQESVVNVTIEINGDVYISTSFTTDLIQYTNFENMNMNGNLDPVTLTANQSNTAVLKTLFDTNGSGNVDQFKLRLVTDNGFNPNGYIDNVKIGASSIFDVTWSLVSSGVWETTISYSEIIMNGNNFFNTSLGTENYTVQGTGTSDDFTFSLIIIDDAGTEIGGNTTGVVIQFQN